MTGHIKISTLQNRYGLNSRQAVYDRINGLEIVPVQKGFVSSEQLDLLDRLDKHIKFGGAIADFPKMPEVDPPALERINQVSEPQLDLSNIIHKLIEVVGSQNQSRSRLDKYRELQEIALNKWVIPTSDVYSLANFKPRGEKATYGCFLFLRAGKVGRQAGWLVEKIETESISAKYLST